MSAETPPRPGCPSLLACLSSEDTSLRFLVGVSTQTPSSEQPSSLQAPGSPAAGMDVGARWSARPPRLSCTWKTQPAPHPLPAATLPLPSQVVEERRICPQGPQRQCLPPGTGTGWAGQVLRPAPPTRLLAQVGSGHRPSAPLCGGAGGWEGGTGGHGSRTGASSAPAAHLAFLGQDTLAHSRPSPKAKQQTKEPCSSLHTCVTGQGQKPKEFSSSS